MAKARLVINITGEVKGVGFRYQLRQKAANLGLTGWVSNESGGVKAVAEGERDKLETLLAWCQEGPPMANVLKVDHWWETSRDEFNSFNIQ